MLLCAFDVSDDNALSLHALNNRLLTLTVSALIMRLSGNQNDKQNSDFPDEQGIGLLVAIDILGDGHSKWNYFHSEYAP